MYKREIKKIYEINLNLMKNEYNFLQRNDYNTYIYCIRGINEVT